MLFLIPGRLFLLVYFREIILGQYLYLVDLPALFSIKSYKVLIVILILMCTLILILELI